MKRLHVGSAARSMLLVFKAAPDAVKRVAEGDKNYVVVPLVLMTEGVRHAANSRYPEFVSAAEIEASAPLWDGQPTTLDHPKVRDGDDVQFVSAGSDEGKPFVIGQFRQPTAADGKLHVEAWIDEAEVKRLASHDDALLAAEAAQLIARIEAGHEVEVSAGYFCAVDAKIGEHGGLRYAGEQHGIIPDHGAILRSEQTGACSWLDGCGAPRLAEAANRRLSAFRATADHDGHSHLFDEGSIGRTSAAKGHSHGYKPGDTKTSKASGHTHDVPAKALARAVARHPDFKGLETAPWGAIDKSFAAYAKAYLKAHASSRTSVPSSVGDAPAEMKKWIAARTLLGNEEATSVRDLLLFPVVNPENGKLNEGALKAALAGRGGASLSVASRKSADDTARRMLNVQFGSALDRGDCACQLFAVNEVSRRDLETALQLALEAQYEEQSNDYYYLYVVDSFSDRVIYQIGSDLMQQGYAATEDGTVTLDAKPVRVRPVTDFLVINEAADLHDPETGAKRTTSENAPTTEATMETNTETGKTAATDAGKTPTPEAVKEPVAAAKNPTFEEVLASADPATRESIKQGRRLYESRRTTLIDALVKAAPAVYSKEKLETKTFEELEELSRFASAVIPQTSVDQPNFVGLGLPRVLEADDNETVAKPAPAFKIGSRPDLLRKGATVAADPK